MPFETRRLSKNQYHVQHSVSKKTPPNSTFCILVMKDPLVSSISNKHMHYMLIKPQQGFLTSSKYKLHVEYYKLYAKHNFLYFIKKCHSKMFNSITHAVLLIPVNWRYRIFTTSHCTISIFFFITLLITVLFQD